jgi:phosphoserine phosphatase
MHHRESNPKKEDKTLTTRVIIVRHGKSSYNLERRIQGRLDASVLTEQGQATAQLVAEALLGITFDAIYSSPLQRAKETAKVIFSNLESEAQHPSLQTSENLMEIDLPLWAGMQRDVVKEKFSDDYKCWQERPDQFCMTVAENTGSREHFPVLAIYEQAKNFWQETLPKHNGKTILIVAHNGINRALISTAAGIPPAYYHSIQQSNCGISVLNFPDNWTPDKKTSGSVQLESMNITTHVGEKFPNPREGHQGIRLLLIRHGETEWNRQSKFQGQIDVPLNDNGRSQAKKASDFLEDVQLDFAITSPMLRPKETAENIIKFHPELELELYDGLREISHGLWEGKFENEIEHSFPGLLEKWKTTPETVQMPEGENLQQVWERVAQTWQTIIENIKPGSTGIVVAHDATNKAILCQLFNLSPEHFWKFKQGNGAVTVIDYPKGPKEKPVLQALNITSHLSGSILDKTAAGAL